MSLFGGFATFDEPVVIHRRTRQVDGAGKPILTPAGDPAWKVTDRPALGAFAPTGSTEDELRGTATDQPAIYFPAGQDVQRTDTITARGTDYQITDIPGAWSDMGVEVRLQAVKGEPR